MVRSVVLLLTFLSVTFCFPLVKHDHSINGPALSVLSTLESLELSISTDEKDGAEFADYGEIFGNCLDDMTVLIIREFVSCLLTSAFLSLHTTR